MSKVLLIDDDPQINEVVKATLELLGHTVAAVEDPRQSQKVFDEFHPDVTLVDYSLPGQSGLDLMLKLGKSRPDAIRFLATGMSDFGLLRQAVAAGASSMLCKPYRVVDLVGLIETAALLDAALQAEASASLPDRDQLHVSCSAKHAVQSADLAMLVHFARAAGYDDDIALHRLPIAACELMRNAASYGSSGTDGTFSVTLKNQEPALELRVQSSGPAFDWEKTLARARAGMGKSRASGLQLVIAISDNVCYEDEGRLACVRFNKRTTGADS